MGRKVCLRCKGKTFGVLSTNFWIQCSALLPQVNFPANNLNFHWKRRWWDQIQAIFLDLFDFKYNWSRTTTTLQNTYNITYYTICCTYYIHIKEKEKNIYDEIRQKTTTNPTAKTYYTWSPYTRSYTHDVIAYNNVTEKKLNWNCSFFEKKSKNTSANLGKTKKKTKTDLHKNEFCLFILCDVIHTVGTVNDVTEGNSHWSLMVLILWVELEIWIPFLTLLY